VLEPGANPAPPVGGGVGGRLGLPRFPAPPAGFLGLPAVLVVVLVVALEVVLVAALEVVLVVALEVVLVAVGVEVVAGEDVEDDLPEPQPAPARASTSAAARLGSFIAVVLSAADAAASLANALLTTAGTL
jgi:hypothetical protein